jgi:hypothetical protein
MHCLLGTAPSTVIFRANGPASLLHDLDLLNSSTVYCGQPMETNLWYYGIMAARKMTFSLPETLAAVLLKRVPPRNAPAR